MGDILTIDDRINASKRASAVVRAWEVAKSLEKDRAQIEGLRWVEPERPEGKGITRKIDFSSEFPEGTTYLQPVPMNINILAPAKLLVPTEDIEAVWTMPLLTRMTKTDYELDPRVRDTIGGGYSSQSLRNTVDVVSFLPFPKADAPEEERFKPEFCVSLEIKADLGKPENYYAAVAKYKGNVIRKLVTGGYPNYVMVFADPYTQTHFSADMVVNMSEEDQAKDPENSGTLDIFVYRITKSGFCVKDLTKAFEEADLGRIESESGMNQYGSDSRLFSPSLSYRGPTKGLDLEDTRLSSRLSVLPDVPRTEKPSPKSVAKEVGDVSLGKGTEGEKVETENLEGYGYDSGFAIQPIRIRFLGVREAAEQAAMVELKKIAVGYRS